MSRDEIANKTVGPFCTNGLSLDTPIYRIHRQRFLPDLFAGKLFLPVTHRWDDPYENLISWCAYEVIGEDKKIEQTFLGGGNRFPVFGQCWSTVLESDALWRIYSGVDKNRASDASFSDHEGVKLRTTARMLVNALSKGMGDGSADKCFVGAVNYMDESELQTYVVNAVGTYREKAFGETTGHADALLLKRSAFAHEHEVRLLYVDADRKYVGKEFIEVPIDVNAVIEEIILDPRVRAGGGGEEKRTEWLKANGFKNKIDASNLYLRTMFQIPLYTQDEMKQVKDAREQG
jgi:hypothetical protein